MKQHARSAFTLIEIVLFVSLISIVFVGISYGVTYSLRNTKLNEKKIIGTKYGDELREWLRGEKETDWTIFTSKASGGAGTKYCFNNGVLAWPAAGICSPSYGLQNIYKREATLITTGTDRINVNIQVEWKDGDNTFSIKNNTIFSQWE